MTQKEITNLLDYNIQSKITQIMDMQATLEKLLNNAQETGDTENLKDYIRQNTEEVYEYMSIIFNKCSKDPMFPQLLKTDGVLYAFSLKCVSPDNRKSTFEKWLDAQELDDLFDILAAKNTLDALRYSGCTSDLPRWLRYLNESPDKQEIIQKMLNDPEAFYSLEELGFKETLFEWSPLLTGTQLSAIYDHDPEAMMEMGIYNRKIWRTTGRQPSIETTKTAGTIMPSFE